MKTSAIRRPALPPLMPVLAAAVAACMLLLVEPVLAQQSKSAAPDAPIYKASSTIVLEDVTVLDAHGNPVHGLKQGQFHVFEDGKPMEIRSFEEHSTPSAEQLAKVPPMPKMSPGVFTNYTPAPVAGAINIILMDSLNTPLQNQAYVKAQLFEFIKSMKPGTRVAIFGMNRELHLLQGFTSDPEVLKAAMKSKKGDYHQSMLMNDAVGGDYGPDTTMSDALSDSMLANDPNFAEALASIQQFEAEEQAFQLELRAMYTLDCMNQLARYLVGIPGKKNLIWFSASFPIDLLPNGDIEDPFSAMGDSEDEFRETVTMFARAHVAVFPVDSRGLMVNPLMNAENSGVKYADPSKGHLDTQQFFDQTSSEHSTMLQMAEKTGGRAFINTNGLKDAVDKAIEAGSNYYSISYYPSSHKWDFNYHSISVKLDNPKLKYKLTYRIGYYADDPNGPPNKKNAPLLASSTEPPVPMLATRETALQAAMQFGAPEPTQVVIKLRVVPMGQPEDQPAPGNEPAPKVKGPYQRYAVDYAADARNIQFTPNPDGTFKVTLEFAAIIYDDQGNRIMSLNRTAGAEKITAAKKATMMHSGMQFHQEISVPVKGDFYLRAGIHDRVGDAMGAVELDLNLAKAQAAAAQADLQAAAAKAAAAKAAAAARPAPAAQPAPAAAPPAARP